MRAGGVLEVLHKDWGLSRSWDVAGGGGPSVTSLVEWQHKLIPELVMDGLEIADIANDGLAGRFKD